MAIKKHTEKEMKAWMTHCANKSRDVADEMAGWRGGCDDPMHPWGPQVFSSWVDFAERVAVPLVEADGEDVAVQKAMALYRKQSPYGICLGLFFALKKIQELEKKVTDLENTMNTPYGEKVEE